MERRFIKHSIDITVTRYYTDTDGVILAKANAAVLAAGLNIKFPFYMFGAFDKSGGYKIGVQALAPKVPAFYLESFVNGAGASSLSILGSPSGLNEIQGKLNIGDIVHVFTDSFSAPSVYVWLVQSSNAVPIAAIIDNTKTTQDDNSVGALTVNEFRYLTLPNTVILAGAQYNEPIRVVEVDNIGDFKSRDVLPSKFRGPMLGLNNVVNIKLKFPVTQFYELATYFLYDTDTIQFTFIIEQVGI